MRRIPKTAPTRLLPPRGRDVPAKRLRRELHAHHGAEHVPEAHRLGSRGVCNVIEEKETGSRG